MITLKLILDTRRIKKDQTYPLVFRITLKRQSRDLHLKIYLKKEDWDTKTSTIKSTQLANIYLPIIEAKRIEILTKTMEFRAQTNGQFDIQELKNYLTGKSSQSWTFKQLWQDEIEHLRSTKRDGSADAHLTALRVLDQIKTLDVPIKSIDYKYLKHIERVLLERKCKINTVGVYLRSFRIIYNRAILERLVPSEYYPFRDYKIKTQRVAPRNINSDQMKRLLSLELPPNTVLFNHLNYAKMLFFLRGINFKDLALLKKENFSSGRINYFRAKTGKHYSIEVNQYILDILDFYQNENRLTLLPILSNNDLENSDQLNSTVKLRRNTANKYLAKLGELADINQKVTTYVFRYSWANIAKSLGYSKDLIAEGLGHEYGNSVTGIYLNDFDEEKIDEMNQTIIRSVLT